MFYLKPFHIACCTKTCYVKPWPPMTLMAIHVRLSWVCCACPSNCCLIYKMLFATTAAMLFLKHLETSPRLPLENLFSQSYLAWVQEGHFRAALALDLTCVSFWWDEPAGHGKKKKGKSVAISLGTSRLGSIKATLHSKKKICHYLLLYRFPCHLRSYDSLYEKPNEMWIIIYWWTVEGKISE